MSGNYAIRSAAALFALWACAAVHAQTSSSDPAAASPYRSKAYTSFDNPYARGGIYDPYRASPALSTRPGSSEQQKQQQSIAQIPKTNLSKTGRNASSPTSNVDDTSSPTDFSSDADTACNGKSSSSNIYGSYGSGSGSSEASSSTSSATGYSSLGGKSSSCNNASSGHGTNLGMSGLTARYYGANGAMGMRGSLSHDHKLDQLGH